MGIAILPEIMLTESLSEKKLNRVLDEYCLVPIYISLYVQKNLKYKLEDKFIDIANLKTYDRE